MAEGARFEASTGSETIGSNSSPSVQPQSLTSELEIADEPVKPDRTR